MFDGGSGEDVFDVFSGEEMGMGCEDLCKVLDRLVLNGGDAVFLAKDPKVDKQHLALIELGLTRGGDIDGAEVAFVTPADEDFDGGRGGVDLESGLAVFTDCAGFIDDLGEEGGMEGEESLVDDNLLVGACGYQDDALRLDEAVVLVGGEL